MNVKKLTAPLLLLAFSVQLQAQIQTITNFTTGTFNTNSGWVRNDALAYQVDGQPETGQNYDAAVADQWYTDDPYNLGLDVGATSILKLLPGWTLGSGTAGNNSVLFGGYGLADGILPGSADPSLYRSFTLMPLTETVTFTADFGLIASSGLFPNKDRFGFNLLNSDASVSLAQFLFDPTASASGPSALGMQWISGGVTNNIADIFYGSLYRLTATLEGAAFDLTVSGLTAQTNGVGVVTNYSVTNSFLLVSGGALAGGQTALDFGTVGVNWELVSGDATDAGSNYMILNNASVLSTAIPEPGTWAVAALLLGGLATRVWRRSANKTAAQG
jgi:hypothetical protein